MQDIAHPTEKKNVYQPHSNNIDQLYNTVSQENPQNKHSKPRELSTQ